MVSPLAAGSWIAASAWLSLVLAIPWTRSATLRERPRRSLGLGQNLSSVAEHRVPWRVAALAALERATRCRPRWDPRGQLLS